MEDKKKSGFARAMNSFGKTVKNLFVRKKDHEQSVLEIEALQTPWRTVMKNFRQNRLGIIGVVGIVLIILFSFVGSLFTAQNLNYTELTQSNMKPGTNYLDVPKDLVNRADDIVKIVSGSSFSVALTTDGKLHIWGVECNQRISGISDYIMLIPSKLKDIKFVDIEAGTKHVIALGSDGKLYGWGYKANSLTQLPKDEAFTSKIESGMIKIKKLYATAMWSAVLCSDGNLYLWGGQQSINVFLLPSETKGRIADCDAGDNNLVLLLDDGTVRVVGERGTEYFTNVPPELMDGSVKVVEIASSNRNVLALDDKGNLYTWGSTQDGLANIPEFSGKIKSTDGNYKNFTLLLEDGSIISWGASALNQNDIPKEMGPVREVFGAYSRAYALGQNGKVYAWGNEGYPFGSDQFGRDVLVRIIHGGRISLTVGAIAVAISTVIALFIGMVSGFFGGWVDMILMRLTDVFQSIPFLPIAITLSAFIGNKISAMNRMYLIMVIIGVLSWTGLARLIRAQILLEREKDFVLAARALGIKQSKIITRHILPNIFNLVIVNVTLGYASSLLTEAGLSFLGFGVAEPTPSWGNMLTSAQQVQVIENYWWRWIIPALFVVLAALSVNLIGDALREAMDPKASER